MIRCPRCGARNDAIDPWGTSCWQLVGTNSGRLLNQPTLRAA